MGSNSTGSMDVCGVLKIFLIKEIFSLCEKAVGKERPFMFPKSGAVTETDSRFQSLT
jgi:hypothetical protein